MKAISLFLLAVSFVSSNKVPVNMGPLDRKDTLKYIYLTFDDGPLRGSQRIDSLVLAEKLKISVFLVGQNAQKSRELGTYLSMYEQNPFVESYNHSYTHGHNRYKKFYKDPLVVLSDIEKNETALSLRYKIVRLPGRNIWRVGDRKKDDGVSGKAAADTLAARGFKLFGWDLEWRHNPKSGAPVQSVDAMTKEIENRLINGGTFTKDHIVVLVHDEMFQKPWATSELNKLIDTLRKKDYVFEHIRFYP